MDDQFERQNFAYSINVIGANKPGFLQKPGLLKYNSQGTITNLPKERRYGMKLFSYRRSVLVCTLAIILIFGGGSNVAAKKISISFDDYHGYTGTVKYLKAVARANPDITELLEIGKSNPFSRHFN